MTDDELHKKPNSEGVNYSHDNHEYTDEEIANDIKEIGPITIVQNQNKYKYEDDELHDIDEPTVW